MGQIKFILLFFFFNFQAAVFHLKHLRSFVLSLIFRSPQSLSLSLTGTSLQLFSLYIYIYTHTQIIAANLINYIHILLLLLWTKLLRTNAVCEIISLVREILPSSSLFRSLIGYTQFNRNAKRKIKSVRITKDGMELGTSLSDWWWESIGLRTKFAQPTGMSPIRVLILLCRLIIGVNRFTSLCLYMWLWYTKLKVRDNSIFNVDSVLSSVIGPLQHI